jgi:putative phosphoesterase
MWQGGAGGPVLVGVVSDVHCSYRNLCLALDHMDALGVQDYIAAGDLVLEYRYSGDVVRTVRDRRMHAVKGNHELVLLGPHGARARAGAEADPAEVAYLEALPLERSLTLDGLRVHLTHGSPWLPRHEYLLPSSPRLLEVDSLGVDVFVYGHTHVPLVRQVGRTLVVNPGSLGMKNGPGPHFTYAVLDTQSRTAQIHHVGGWNDSTEVAQ